MDVKHGVDRLNALFERLERKRATLKYHPTIDKIERGQLTMPQVRHWATQLFVGNKAHNANILGLIYAKCDDFGARKSIVENLNEEELGRQSGVLRSHPELYLEFGEALGIPRDKGRGLALKGSSVLEHLRHHLLERGRERSTRHRAYKDAIKGRGAGHRPFLSARNAQP